ncbi:hypothetical protein ACEOHO_003528 [Vibrio vulnificus]|nr:hypothetical protein [Vibrio vulnificus]HAS8528415.1 hypothetical protein [Vibrio vulnificus]
MLESLKKLFTHHITNAVVIIHFAAIYGIYNYDPTLYPDFFIVWSAGIVLSAVELGSRYKDEPSSVLTSSPGVMYLVINGLICCLGFFLIQNFSWHFEVDEILPLMAQRTMDIMQAALGSMMIMRSSFIKLGNDSQTDLGLNIVLKKLLAMVDREVDRVRATKRSKDVTAILKGTSYSDTRNKVITYCLDVMQNISPEERRKLKFELNAIDAQDECVDRTTRKYSAGLLIYNIVGQSVLESAVRDLGLYSAKEYQECESSVDPQKEFESVRDTFEDMLDTTPSNGNSKSVEEGTESTKTQVDEAIEKNI